MLDTSFDKIIEFIESRKNNAYRKVNEEMILEAKYLHPELSYELTKKLLSGENRPTCILYR